MLHMPSASRIKSLHLNNSAMHALWTFIFAFPIASAPRALTFPYSAKSSPGLIPSTPSGQVKLKSISQFRLTKLFNAAEERMRSSAGPAAIPISAGMQRSSIRDVYERLASCRNSGLGGQFGIREIPQFANNSRTSNSLQFAEQFADTHFFINFFWLNSGVRH